MFVDWHIVTFPPVPPMTNQPPSTGSLRAAQGFLNQSLLAAELGISHQLLEDKELRGDEMTLRGNRVSNFGLCSYLGLADDPRLTEAAIDAIHRYGNSYSSSPAYTALPLYKELGDGLTEMLDAHVVIAGTTTLAHHAALPVIVERGDTVLIDNLAHASLHSVMPSLIAKGADVKKIGHNDFDRIASAARTTSGRVWYVIDGVYSMHGDIAPPSEIRRLLDENEALWVYCDDAHGFGWSGHSGRGSFLDECGWHDRLVMTYGLSKSFGALGGVVAAQDLSLIQAIEFVGGPMVFGGPIPPASLGAGIASAEIHLSDELTTLQTELGRRIDFVNEHSARIGLPLSDSSHSPLWFVEIGQSMTAGSVVARMVRDGFFVNVAVYPVVPRDRAGVRFTVTRYNSFSQIESMLDSLNSARLRHEGDDDVIDLTALED